MYVNQNQYDDSGGCYFPSSIPTFMNFLSMGKLVIKKIAIEKKAALHKKSLIYIIIHLQNYCHYRHLNDCLALPKREKETSAWKKWKKTAD